MNAAKGLRFRHKMKPEELLSREFKVIRFALNEKRLRGYSALPDVHNIHYKNCVYGQTTPPRQTRAPRVWVIFILM